MARTNRVEKTAVLRAIAAIAGGFAVTAVAQQAYELTDLGTLGGSTANAYGINRAGQVAGSSTTAGAATHAFTYSDGTMTDLGTLGGATSEAYGINDAGQVVGYASTSADVDHAATWTGTTATDLGTNGASNGYAYGINSSGQIVGTVGCPSGTAPLDCGTGAATLWTGLNATTLPFPAGFMSPTMGGAAFAINDGGQIVGVVNGLTPLSWPVSWVGGAATELFNEPPFAPNDAFGINSSGAIVGNYGLGPDPVPMSWSGTTHIQLGLNGASGGYAYSINDGGQIVGSLFPAGSPSYAVFWPSISATPIDLNTTLRPQAALANMLTEARAINANGLIIANGTVVATGASHAYLLTPAIAAGPPTATLSASSATVLTGQSFVLTWSSTNAWGCTGGGSGPAGSPWSGALATSGAQTVQAGNEPGDITATLICSFGNQPSTQVQALVTVENPALTVALNASPTSLTSGHATTLTWTSANATACTASGGEPGDGWAMAQATGGSASITEAVAVVSPLTLTFTITCTNSGTGQSTPASVKVTLNPPASSSSSSSSGGGGGAVDLYSVAGLATLMLLQRRRRVAF